MNPRTLFVPALAALALVGLTACNAHEDTSAGGLSSVGDTVSAHEEVRGTRPTREILESDLYRLVNDQLYVYTATVGIHAIDLRDATAPTIRATEAIFGPAGELYARDDQVILVLEQASIGCVAPEGMPATYQGSEIVVLTDRGEALEVESRTCIAGTITDTRLRGDILYVVSADSDLDQTFAAALDLENPREVSMPGHVALSGESREIFLNDEALFVARTPEFVNDSSWGTDTEVTLIDISRLDGRMQERGTITLTGAPQGRFHMDATASHFRIVTFDESRGESQLHVVDIHDPDHLSLAGSLEGIARGERLHATRFVGDRAYIVTFEQVDPLWVIDLSDPGRPRILGELEVPGWSDFIFPRENDRLLTVGRGEQMGIAVSLFDVSDPGRPRQLSTVEFGDSQSQSEAISDFRGAQIIEAGLLGEATLIAIPTATEGYSEARSEWACTPSLFLVDLVGDQLQARGSAPAVGAIRRSFASGGQLLALTDVELRSLDLSDRDAPRTTAVVTLGDAEAAPYACEFTDERVWGGMWMGDDMVMACSVEASSQVSPSTALLLGLFFAGLGLVRPRRRR